ncbi:ABC transporter ATP-binding protein [Clostridium algidicarnis]|uniref:ABC transporter ATP-binding protein n=1 Tax=Clostridium algidicarnis TaxID=37659 RepID=UPI0004971B4F|nr:ABC transporter ATP-binding protein [Clostridium algidicarnis]MBB6697744.1 ABC transporter ATP-binding protein [Clostridium algidicarnis]MBU3192858.1 ABC transporter ATP-binding protein [Clostridium algidicarnis]MBU3203551.1 ABC transporter ATP-binding protein [Clostridium algidicarnis]MBU3211705.1 ABC transporter ATP-binding protein [Clostridium algidicarnis]MBU3221787.1 ABC transporter ATP-binding protein [Clostridium algidicarnis]
MEILKVMNLKKIYGEGEIKVEALKGINLSIERGQMVAIMGPSGCGKSTLLNLLSGVDAITSGEIKVDNTDISNLDENHLALYRRRQLGVIYQFFNLISNLSVENNIKLPVLMDDKNVDQEHFDDLIKNLGIESKLKVFPDKLSGGQQQRVAIARSLIYKPSIILADEPTGNLDKQNARDIIEIFRLSNLKYNQTIIIVTHDEEVALSADRIVRMEDGLIISDEVIR